MPCIMRFALYISCFLEKQHRIYATTGFPFLIVIADWCENLCLAMATHAFPERADALVRSASLFTSLKWVFIALTILMLLAAVTCYVARAVRGR